MSKNTDISPAKVNHVVNELLEGVSVKKILSIPKSDYVQKIKPWNRDVVSIPDEFKPKFEKVTKDFLKATQKFLKEKGVQLKKTKQSAMSEIDSVLPDGRHLAITWHQRDNKYNQDTYIMTLLIVDNGSYTEYPITNVLNYDPKDGRAITNTDFVRYRDALSAATEYINSLFTTSETN